MNIFGFSGRTSQEEYRRYARFPFLFVPVAVVVVYGVYMIGVLKSSSLTLLLAPHIGVPVHLALSPPVAGGDRQAPARQRTLRPVAPAPRRHRRSMETDRFLDPGHALRTRRTAWLGRLGLYLGGDTAQRNLGTGHPRLVHRPAYALLVAGNQDPEPLRP